jgi:predicted dehydrogenase
MVSSRNEIVNTEKFWNWGILAPGHIAQSFVTGLAGLSQANRYAVASRSLEKAQQFAQQYGFSKAYGSYQELYLDPEVNIIYVASPNHLHFEHTIAALQAGKHVLCEKPFGLNSQEVKIMSTLALEKKLFLMEALWTRFLPSYQKVVEWIHSGMIGEPCLLTANFGFVATYNPESRLFNPRFGCGALADIGIYPAFLALTLFGYPLQIQTHTQLAATGVDMTTTVQCVHSHHVLSQLSCSFATRLETEAYISGTLGSIHMHRNFHMPCKLTLTRNDGEVEEFPADASDNGYRYEALEVMQCLNSGKRESDLWPLSKSAELLHFLEQIKGS